MEKQAKDRLGNATARPWSVIDSMNHIHAFPITNEHGESVGCVYSAETISSDDKASKKLDRQPTAKANAALIVRAVNSHDALVEALEKAYSRLQTCEGDKTPDGESRENIEELELIESALKLAKGE